MSIPHLRRASFSITTLGGVRGGLGGLRKSVGIGLGEEFARLSASTVASRSRAGGGGREALAAKQVAQERNIRRLQKEKEEKEKAEREEEGYEEGYEEGDEENVPPPEETNKQEEPADGLSEVSKFTKFAAERDEREKQIRKIAVDARLKDFGMNLDQVYHEMSGVGDWMDRTVKVKVIKGKDLPICDAKKSDPYVKLTLGTQSKVSSVMRSNLNPVWNEHFKFKVKGGGHKKVLKVNMYDQDLLPADYNEDGDDHMGGFEVCLDDEVPMDQPRRKWYHLQGGDLKEIRGKKQEQNGKVELEIFWSIAAPKTLTSANNVSFTSRRGTASVASMKANLQSMPPPPSAAAPIAGLPPRDDASRMTDDSKRMVLVSHVGRLRHASSDVRRMAVQALAKTAGKRGVNLPKSGGWAATLIKNFTERIEKDQVFEVRLDALEALVITSTKGVPEAVKTVAVALKDPNRDVRLAAVTAMQQVATGGDEVAIFGVAERLEDSDFRVRESAGTVLCQLSTVHDERLVQQVLLRLSSIHSVVRKNAVRTLVTVSTPGAPQVLDGIKLALRDSDPQVRIAAMQVLNTQVSRGDESAVKAVLTELSDPVPDVRAAASECLSLISARSDKRVIAALTSLLSDSGKDLYGHLIVRGAALRAVAAVSRDGEGAPASPRTKRMATKGALGCLEEDDWWVRRNAAEALKSVAMMEEGSDEVAEKLVGALQDQHAQVRRAAGDSLGHLVPPKDTWLHATLAVKLVGKGAEVRSTVAGLLQRHIIAHKEEAGELTGREHIMRAALTTPKHNNDLHGLASPTGHSFLGDTSPTVPSSPMAGGRRLGALLQSPIAERGGGGINKASVASLASMRPKSSHAALGGATPGGSRGLRWGGGDSFRNTAITSSIGESTTSRSLRGRLQSAASMRSLSPSSANDRSFGSMDEDEDEPAWMQALRFLRKVKHGRACTPDDALAVLLNTVEVGDERALMGLLWSLNDEDDVVRAVAIQALQKLTRIGQKLVVERLQGRLSHSNWQFRKDATYALSLVCKRDDREVSAKVLELLDDDNREVRAGVQRAAANLFFPGDDRIVVAQACVMLEHEYHSEGERQEALDRLGNLAYKSSHLKLQGFSVEDADMKGFWQQLRMPKEGNNQTDALLPKIIRLFSDGDAFVRRAAVRASVEFAAQGDERVTDALRKLLSDESFTVRVVAVEALADLSVPGDGYVIDLLYAKLDDHSHLVRHAAVMAMHKMVKTGDRRTGGKLLMWLREAWKHSKGRGDDFDVKKEVAAIAVTGMGVAKGADYSLAFSKGLMSKSLHTQRNAVARFQDKMTEIGLLEPEQLTRHFETQTSSKKYTAVHRNAATKIQKWVKTMLLVRTMKRIHKKQEKTKLKYKKAAGGPGRTKMQRKKALLWFMQEEDKIAEKVVKNKVPEQTRNTAISTAHEKALAGTDDMDLWERMRWTERLRLCEEIAGHPF